MSDDDLTQGSDENFLILNFATRLFTAMTDRSILIPTALEAVADFAGNRPVALLTPAETPGTLRVEGYYSDHTFSVQDRRLSSEEVPPQANAGARLDVRVCPRRSGDPIPLPAREEEENSERCLCLPVVGRNHHFLGILTLGLEPYEELDTQEVRRLRTLSAVLAIAIENADLFAEAVVDGVTGAYVRRYYELRIREELARFKRYPGTLSIVFLDLDYFKNVNDTFGHPAGDSVLKEFVDLVKSNVRDGIDLVCRYGGEEFVILMPSTNRQSAARSAERLRDLCGRHVFAGLPPDMRITLSAGVVTVDDRDLVTAAELLKRADMMLYQAKRSGRNQVCIWDS